jgi:uncharacterized SAM-binding protein YcdF (DUF218 family)
VFLALSKALDLLAAPLSWAVLLVGAGLVRRGRPGVLLGTAGLAVLVGFSLEPVADALTRRLEAAARSTFREGATYDAVVVLGGAMAPGASRARGRLELNQHADRILAAYQLLRAGRAREVLISGGVLWPVPGEVPEAERTAELLRSWGIDPGRIHVEVRSRNTRENALESARVVAERGWKSLLLVTSAAHVPRALGCFRAAGLAPDVLPVDYEAGDGARRTWLPRAEFLEASTDALREALGRRVYRLAGYARDG